MIISKCQFINSLKSCNCFLGQKRIRWDRERVRESFARSSTATIYIIEERRLLGSTRYNLYHIYNLDAEKRATLQMHLQYDKC